MEGDFIKINKWLRPLSWFYGFVVSLRNTLFEIGVLKSRSFNTPVISVGNITVGGTGKTPHVEYLIGLLKDRFRVAVLSRGYKRKTRGFLIASAESTERDIGDEPLQMYQKHPDVVVAVDRNRCNGISRLTGEGTDGEGPGNIDVVVLDDAFQHRYVNPGINILLVDYHRLIVFDELLPAGRLREPLHSKNRADMVIVTKCPPTLKPMEYRVITKQMELYPYQQLYFTCLRYGEMTPLFDGEPMCIDSIDDNLNILVLTGIASPKQLITDLSPHTSKLHPLTFGDHHRFTRKDAAEINYYYGRLPLPKIIITTEKDSTRLRPLKGLSDEARKAMYVLPIEVEFMCDQKERFDENIIGYVRKNSRNSILAKAEDGHLSQNGHHTRHRSRATGL